MSLAMLAANAQKTATAEAASAPPTETQLPDTNPAKPDDLSEGRLRIAQCVFGARDSDVYIDGVIPVDAGIKLSNVGFGGTRYEYLQPGTHKVAVVPAGEGLDKSLLPSTDVQVAAGHRYTVVILGQEGDATHKALVIDETSAYQAVGAKPTDIANIAVNNLKGVQGIDYTVSGKLAHSNIPFGGYKADIWTATWTAGDTVSVTGSPDKVLVQESDTYFNTPGFDNLDCWGGTYPGGIGSDYDNIENAQTTSLSALDFLQGLTAESAKNGGNTPSFSTFLAAVKKAGLSDMLAKGGPYTMFPPTDTAFKALPKEQLDSLMADPKALGEALRRQIVEGYYPPQTIVTGVFRGYFDRTLTNMLGEPLKLNSGSGLMINNDNVGSGASVMAANGTRVFYQIDEVLPAPKK